MTINYNNNASITSIVPNTGVISNQGDVYTLAVPDGTQVVKATITLGDKFGLLYINNLLVNDGKAQTFTVNGENKTYELTAYAEDHTTSKKYTLKIEQTLPKTDPSDNKPAAPDTTTPAPAATPAAGGTVNPTPAPSKASATPKKGKKAKITISGKKTVKVGKTIRLKAKLKNVKGTVKWSVNKKKIAKINAKTGKLKGLKAGKVKVTAKVKKVKASVTVKVKK